MCSLMKKGRMKKLSFFHTPSCCKYETCIYSGIAFLTAFLIAVIRPLLLVVAPDTVSTLYVC